jgi:serine phosphatase RsbU (regulator of sigma subunit)
MKSLFHKWLLLFVILSFGLTFGLSWHLHRKEAKNNALKLLEVNLNDVAARVKREEANLQTITEMSAASAIAKTRALALLIQENPSILKDTDALNLIRKKLDVDELHVSDKNGKLIASLGNSNYHGKDNYLGFNLAEKKQSRVFMQAVTDPAFELVQEPQYSGADGRLFQYSGVARLDEPGVVQIGYRPERIKKAQQLADVKNIESEIRIGINGKLTITGNTQHPADYKKVFHTREGLCQSIVCGKYLLTAMLPWEEVYSKNRTVIIALFIGNIIVFSLIFGLIAGLLHKVVIKEISAVTDSIEELSQGNFDKKIEAKNSSEMYALAESINKTVNILKKRNFPERAESDAEITTMLKNSLKPDNVPEHSNYKFTAEIFTASEIGSNLCDVFKIDKEHIAVFFADIMEKGVTQGLYMMKAKNMLKKALLKHPPEKALHAVNEELFNSREKNIPLKVFLGILNLRSGVLLTFNYGHVNPIIKSKNGNTSFISGPFNPLLGASYDSEFIPLSLPLNAGDYFYFYSNDMIELQNARGEKYGRERLLDVISSSGNNAAETVRSVRQAVMDFGGETSHEADIAIAVLEYTPESTERQTL